LPDLKEIVRKVGIGGGKQAKDRWNVKYREGGTYGIKSSVPLASCTCYRKGLGSFFLFSFLFLGMRQRQIKCMMGWEDLLLSWRG